MVIIDKKIPATKIDSRIERKIPYNLFVTWKSNDMSEEMYQNMMNNITNNPEYDFYFYDDHDMRNFIETHFDKDILDTYDNLIPGAFRSDLWRLCILYIYGGIYIDCKTVFYVTFDSIINKNITHDMILCRDRCECCIYNAILISTKENKILTNIIKDIVYNSKKDFFGIGPLEISGPLLCGKNINIANKFDPHCAINKIEYCGEYKISIPLIFPIKYERDITDRDDNIVVSTYYEGYYNRDNCTSRYAELYYDLQVYRNFEIHEIKNRINNIIYKKYFDYQIIFENRSLHNYVFPYLEINDNKLKLVLIGRLHYAYGDIKIKISDKNIYEGNIDDVQKMLDEYAIDKNIYATVPDKMQYNLIQVTNQKITNNYLNDTIQYLKNLNPEFSYIHFDATEQHKYLKNFIKKITLVDEYYYKLFFIFFYLYHNGGVYVEYPSICTKKLMKLVSENSNGFNVYYYHYHAVDYPFHKNGYFNKGIAVIICNKYNKICANILNNFSKIDAFLKKFEDNFIDDFYFIFDFKVEKNNKTKLKFTQ